MTANNNYNYSSQFLLLFLSFFQRANRGTKYGIGEIETIVACEGRGRTQSDRSRSHADSENEEAREGDTNVTGKTR